MPMTMRWIEPVRAGILCVSLLSVPVAAPWLFAAEEKPPPTHRWWSSSTPRGTPERPSIPPGPPYFGEAFNDPPPKKSNPTDEMLARWEAKEAAYWKRLEEEVRQIWNDYRPSSQTVWVDYSEPRDAVSEVDFENGAVVIEAVVAASEPDRDAVARHRIAKKAQAMIGRRGPDGQVILQGMFSPETLDAIDGATLTPESEEIAFTGADGVKRYRYVVRMPLQSGHISRRWERYRGDIVASARRMGVDPALVAAVAHTESAFNPLARSPVPAFGLMQIVPRFAGREAYAQLHGVDAILPPGYLYQPQPNIELGVAYLARLERVYFREVRDPVKRRFMAICAYNWGPAALRRAITPQQANAMTTADLYAALQRRVPAETKNYLRLVEQRRLLYGGS